MLELIRDPILKRVPDSSATRNFDLEPAALEPFLNLGAIFTLDLDIEALHSTPNPTMLLQRLLELLQLICRESQAGNQSH